MIDLFSDSASMPTEEMRAAMARAEVGDEQKLEDPTVNRLLETVCMLLGKEAALFLPSGTMCNVVAVKTHTQPGDAIILDSMSHMLRAETGGPAMLAGVVIDQIPTENGLFTADDLEQRLPRRTVYSPVPRVVCLEQTHNFGGGKIWPPSQLMSVCEKARQHEIATHLDGARLMNAVIAIGISASTWAKPFDSVWIDFTKSLGAPFGAVLCGSRDFIEQARRYKHALGGAMRQAGIMAAACLHALEYNVERLTDDHANARRLASLLAEIPKIQVLTPEPESNMVFFDVSMSGMSSCEFLRQLEGEGVRMSSFDDRVRAVTHLGISESHIEKAAAAVRKVALNFALA